MSTIEKVSWKTYAQKYDMLLSFNPFYQEVHRKVMQSVCKWEIDENDSIADVGAGTGNYSLDIARQFPQANILHIDNDQGMNEVTMKKRSESNITNHRILDKGIHDVQLESGSLKALVSIHAIYTFPKPEKALNKMYDWLEPGGYAVLVNAGRVVRVLDWQIAIAWYLLRNYGFKKTWQIMKEGKEVSKQNAYIRDMQIRGEFWTHTHEEFCEAIQNVGFEILESSITFRGASDFVVVRKKSI